MYAVAVNKCKTYQRSGIDLVSYLNSVLIVKNQKCVCK